MWTVCHQKHAFRRSKRSTESVLRKQVVHFWMFLLNALPPQSLYSPLTHVPLFLCWSFRLILIIFSSKLFKFYFNSFYGLLWRLCCFIAIGALQMFFIDDNDDDDTGNRWRCRRVSSTGRPNRPTGKTSRSELERQASGRRAASASAAAVGEGVRRRRQSRQNARPAAVA